MVRILEQVMTLQEAAKKSGIAATTLRNRIKHGNMPGRKSGGTWLVVWQDVEDYKKSLTKPSQS